MKPTLITLTIIALLNCIPAFSQESAPVLTDRQEVMSQARYLKSICRYDDAIELLAGLLEDGFDEEVHAEIADCFLQNGKYDAATMAYTMLEANAPDKLVYKIRLMNLAFRAKQYEESAGRGKEIIRRDPIPSIISLTGDSYQYMKQNDSALVYYNKYLEINPFGADVLNKKAKILLDRRQYDDVIGITEQYIAADSTNMDIRGINGVASYLKGDYSAAERRFQGMRNDDNDSYSVHFYLGQSLWHLARHYPAIDELERAWQIDSSDVSLAFAMASLLMECGKPKEESRRWLDKALQMVTPDPHVLARIYRKYGESYTHEEDFKTAAAYYQQAFELDPELISALLSLAYCHERLKDWEQARVRYEQYLQLGRQDTGGYDFAVHGLEYVKEQLFMEGKL